MATHTYWRLNFTGGNGGNIAVAELAMHSTVGGSNVATGGTATSSTGTAANAFDGNTGTDCQMTTTSGWIKYQFASPQAIVEYVVTTSATANVNTAPKTWTVDYSDDNSTWTSVAYVSNQTVWAQGEVRTLPVNAGAESGKGATSISRAFTASIPARNQIVIGKAPSTTKTTVSGNVQVGGVNTSGLTVRAYAWATGEYVGEATTDGSGNYSIGCSLWDNVYVVAFDPTTYQAVVFDQVVPG